MERTLARIDEGDAPYQMVGAVGDGIVFECPRAGGGKVAAVKAVRPLDLAALLTLKHYRV